MTPFYNFPDGLPLKCLRSESGRIADSACCPVINVTTGNPVCPAPAQGCPSHGPASDKVENKACRICPVSPEECFDMNQGMWPDHCLQDGDWTFPPSLHLFDYSDDSSELQPVPEVVVKIAKYPFIDAYSAFMDNGKQVMTELDETLRSRSISSLYIAGLATDWTVKHTAIDAVTLGYRVMLLTDAVQGIDAAGTQKALAELQSLGVEMLTTEQVPYCNASQNVTSTSRCVLQINFVL